MVYPLLDLRLSRVDCMRIITAAGLPVPPKSSCWFCPFHRPDTWAQMRRDRPALFDRAADLEELLNVRRAELGKDPVWLTRFNRPLPAAIPTAQDPLPGLDALTISSPDPGPEDDATCDNGACWT